MNRNEAVARWDREKSVYEARGLVLPGVRMFIPDEWKMSEASLDQLAMDAGAGTLSTDPNSALPALLTTAIDPEVIQALFSPLQMAKILTERKVGDWLEQTRMFPIVEADGEVSSYDDYATNGRAGINFNYPNFQSYLFQTFLQYGELETARAGLMRINYVSELTNGAAMLLNRYGNLTYAFGVAGLQNYGLLNFPYLSSALTPAVKAWGGTTWFNGNSPAATANEVYNDIVALWNKVIAQTNDAATMEDPATLAMSPQSALAMKFANSFGVYVEDLLKKGFPKMRIETAVQYGAQTSTNSQGYSAAGNYVQLILDKVQGQTVAYAAFNEKMRAHKIIALPSAWQQKFTQGTWGAIVRQPVGIGSMLGV